VFARCLARRRFSISDTHRLACARTFTHTEARAICGEICNSGKFERLLSRTGYFADDVTGGLSNSCVSIAARMVLSSGVFLWGWRSLASSAHFWISSSQF
jgi:hypothetical protein